MDYSPLTRQRNPEDALVGGARRPIHRVLPISVVQGSVRRSAGEIHSEAQAAVGHIPPNPQCHIADAGENHADRSRVCLQVWHFRSGNEEYEGWIFGGETQPQWTQKIFKKTFKFQNPLRQNYKHVKALEAALDVPSVTIHSLLSSSGEARLKPQCRRLSRTAAAT